MTGPAVLALVQELRATAAWRIAWPFAELQRIGYPALWGWNNDPAASAAIEQADVVILHRSSWLPGDEDKALAWRDLLHRNGKALILETDDDLYSGAIIDLQLQPDLDIGKSLAQLEAERQTNIFALRLVDGVTVSTPHLAEVCRGFTDKPVAVAPNAIDLPRFRAALAGSTRQTAGLTIGWAGRPRPDRDARELAVAWRRIATRFPDVTFVLAGYAPPVLARSVPAGRLRILPNLSLDFYPRNYAEIDIGCCTLADEPFNRSKSPIKAMEFGAAGAAVVASPTVYGDFLTDGEDGLIAATADEWEDHLARLVKFRARRESLALMLLNRVERDHTLAANVGNWPAAWASILAHADAVRDAEVVAYA